MAEEDSQSLKASPTAIPLGRASPLENLKFLGEMSSSSHLLPVQGIKSRRNSRNSDYSLKHARNIFQTSAEDLINPKTGSDLNRNSSTWHLAPLAFALLPALGGIAFKNGNSIVTDIMLLGLAAIFLNWSVRMPWDWYYAAQATRTTESNEDLTVVQESQQENDPYTGSKTAKKEPENLKRETVKRLSNEELPAQKAAASELYRHELLALFSCFTFPLLGAYLLHNLRSQLNRPSEGLISNCNLTIFLLASELRPMAHVVKLIRARTLHLQRVVASRADDEDLVPVSVKDFSRRIEIIEARCIANEKIKLEPEINDQQLNSITTQVRESIQSDFDTLSRALRRYEKRATIQAFQAESRFQELETRLNETISLVAAATATAVNNEHKQRASKSLIEWVATSADLPFRITYSLASSSFKIIISSVQAGRAILLGQNRSKAEKIRSSTNSKFCLGRSSDWGVERSGRKK
ncbi:hypothetical protein K3495_g5822 [Podosphaera aphanis]|nr:hypothetical protein K3495_g5822 [Podosphaera aphanis]